MAQQTPCAACKALRRKCDQYCVMAPYFPQSEPTKFNCVHRVFGASNVSKLLIELPLQYRNDAVNALFYQAEARLRDPIHGCTGLITILQRRLVEIQKELKTAKSELSTYNKTLDPSLLSGPGLPPHNFLNSPPANQTPLVPEAGINLGYPSRAQLDTMARLTRMESGSGSCSARPNYSDDVDRYHQRSDLEQEVRETQLVLQPPAALDERQGN